MEKKALIYSCDNWLSLKSLKEGDYDPSNYDLSRIKNFAEKNHIWSLLEWADNFHYKFLSVVNSPYIIYYMWDISLLDKDIFSIVWPRKIWSFAEQMLDKLFEKVKNYDLVTISGMADWVDWLAHKHSIENNIPTIAVLGWWLKYYLESIHRHKIEAILGAGGLILSEFKLSFKPMPYSFPQRNRLISGLWDVLFLPQARLKSGSLISVNYSLQQKKEVYTVPNTIFDDNSLGTNKLLLERKINLTLDFDDFLSKFFQKKCVSRKKCINASLQLSDIQKSIIKYFSENNNDVSLSQIGGSIGLSFDSLLQEITQLELMWLIFEDSVWCYSLK